MALRGCIDVRHLPLQILLKENPSWRGTPVAVTREQRPQSPILAVSPEAREKGLEAGMKYANALSLVPGLRARAVSPRLMDQARDRILKVVSAFTPDIEPCPFDAEAFWVSVAGLGSLFASQSLWIAKICRALSREGFKAVVVMGFTRFGTYAIARSRQRSLVFSSRAQEKALLSTSSIDILPLPLRTRSTLRKLQVSTLGQFSALPAGDMARRFGREAALLRQSIVSDDPLPVACSPVKETAPSSRRLDAPLTDLGLLMLHIEELLAVETRRAEADRSVISGLAVLLRTEDGKITTDLIRPAAPTLRIPVLRRLIQLRLSGRRFTSGVERIEIRSALASPSGRQAELFPTGGRDLKAGARAFAAIRARFGNESVAFARLLDSHLPERSFRWVPLDGPVLPAPGGERGKEPRRTVRRIFFRPAAGTRNPIRAAGPFAVSGSWWNAGGEDAPFSREYGFEDSPSGLLWVFVDRFTGASWIQGTVD